jgi:preprotein translocase subunit SecG
MNILIWLFTFLLVVDCLVLILLVLIQLPKKEAGMGQAFGGGATDALFGAGSGTALTKLTKYTAGIFFVMTLLISMLHGHQARARSGDLRNILTREEKESAITPAARTNAANTAATNNTLINAATGAVTRITNLPLAPK